MKKVLWVSNVPIESVAKACGLAISSGGGWVQGLYDEIKNDKSISLTICFPNTGINQFSGMIDDISYYSFYQKKNLAGMSDPLAMHKRTKDDIKRILKIVKPDILHVFGTEYAHSLLFLKTFNCPQRSVIHIQGLASAYYYYYYYYADLPMKYIHLITPSSIFRGTIASQQRLMKKRGENETKSLKCAKYLLGRTDWDHACTMGVSKGEYITCGEILRSPFYDENTYWKYDKCEKNSIFVSQASYPIKGLHYLLLALPDIIKNFPDTKLYVAGTDPIKGRSVKGLISRSSYGFYLRKIIKDNYLEDKIVFMGNLSVERMKDRFLKSNVFVLPSSIENSPNSLGEAMILGVPCVASNVGGVSTMLTHRTEGFTYQYNEIHMLSYYIKKVFGDPELSKKIGFAAREHALATHDKNEIGKIVRELYDEIISN